jgi:hypothetical protein
MEIVPEIVPAFETFVSNIEESLSDCLTANIEELTEAAKGGKDKLMAWLTEEKTETEAREQATA